MEPGCTCSGTSLTHRRVSICTAPHARGTYRSGIYEEVSQVNGMSACFVWQVVFTVQARGGALRDPQASIRTLVGLMMARVHEGVRPVQGCNHICVLEAQPVCGAVTCDRAGFGVLSLGRWGVEDVDFVLCRMERGACPRPVRGMPAAARYSSLCRGCAERLVDFPCQPETM